MNEEQNPYTAPRNEIDPLIVRQRRKRLRNLRDFGIGLLGCIVILPAYLGIKILIALFNQWVLGRH
ncbi:MAG: hypothetical protein K8T25_24975 [Planctomycetia bacterium]|nr:hypothetical protein [Planctomycetia bacterium]